ncbi:hypothetical protein C7212DRAFT_275641 [Tuber magnatum]|uniref:H-type lectin domain-containing protein n=1 Tax=Tuber magnatum TaxID=42249 RepID=A0A317SYJ2_9PEZI|nr:hypothetical protein C7212DRAFT_275641 [Tuber magnatum]
MSTTGYWYTWDVRSPKTPWKETSKDITFSEPFVAPPRLPIGLKCLDVSKDSNIRVAASAANITKDSFKGSLNAWADTILYSAGASWLELAPGYLEYQTGVFSTTDDHSYNKPQLETSRRINFERSFVTAPKVIVFLRHLDIDKNRNCRVLTKASGIDAKGFTIHINGWSDSILYSASAGWIAYPEDRPYVFSCTAHTMDVRPPNKPQLKNSKRIDFDGLKFWETPKIFMAINSLDFSCKANLRIEVKATDVTQTGLTWHMESWSDSIFFSAGVSILAVV